MRHEISNDDDVVDSRDVIKRIQELEDDWQSKMDDAEDSVSEKDGKYIIGDDESVTYNTEESAIKAAQDKAQEEWDDTEDGEDLKALQDLQSDAEGYCSDWKYGATLIRDSYMDEDWARQELDDLGYISKDLPSLIADNIDWKGVLKDLQQDYTSVEWDDVTYWIR